MAKTMDARLNSFLNSHFQFFASHMHVIINFIKYSVRRAMRDKNMCAIRNQIPMFLDVCPRFSIKCQFSNFGV